MATYEQPDFVKVRHLTLSENPHIMVKLTIDWSSPFQPRKKYRSKTMIPLNLGRMPWAEVRNNSVDDWTDLAFGFLKQTYYFAYKFLEKFQTAYHAELIELSFVDLAGNPLDTKQLDRQIVLNKLTARK